MTKEVKIVIAAAIGLAAFFAFSSIKTEYARITSRIEETQLRIDAVADESKEAIEDIRKVIKTMQQWLTKIAMQQDANQGQETSDIVKADILKAELEKLNDVKSLSERASNSVPTIIMHTMNGCGPCKKWVENDAARWRNAGWDVVVLPPEEGHPAGYPWFEIIDRDGKQFQVDGPLTNSNFNAAKAGVK
jgi:hypothetical protein